LNMSGMDVHSPKDVVNSALISTNVSGSFRLDRSTSNNNNGTTKSPKPRASLSKRKFKSGQDTQPVDSYALDDTLNDDNSDGNQNSSKKHKNLIRSQSSSSSSSATTSDTSKSKRKRSEFNDNLPSSQNKKDGDIYKIPQLSPEEQYDIDLKNERFLPGSRVMALWGHDYYAANICGRDGLGRYYVHFVEDNLNRVLPPNGVIPLSMLVPSTKICFIALVDGEEMGRPAEIISQPSSNADLWVEGMFEVRESESDATQSISWAKIYLSKEQGTWLNLKSTNIAAVERENITTESRGSRRSRSQILPTSPNLMTFSPKKTPNKHSKSTIQMSNSSETHNLSENLPATATIPTSPMKNLSVSLNEFKPESDSDLLDMGTKNALSENNQKTSVISFSAENSTETLDIMSDVEIAPAETLNTQNSSPPSLPVSSCPEIEDSNIFSGLKFVLTSATRTKKNSDFNKRDYRQKIVERGGEIIDDFSTLSDVDRAFLVADTYYRTHKYLSALSLSVPCVGQKWILECVKENALVDHCKYLLPAGESSLDSNIISEWKPLKGSLLLGKRVMVYSNSEAVTDYNVLGFVDIWSPIIRNLGATLIEPISPGGPLLPKLDFLDNNPVDILLTDSDCEKELSDKVESLGGLAVSSEWIIQAIVMGKLPDIDESDRFRYDCI